MCPAEGSADHQPVTPGCRGRTENWAGGGDTHAAWILGARPPWAPRSAVPGTGCPRWRMVRSAACYSPPPPGPWAGHGTGPTPCSRTAAPTMTSTGVYCRSAASIRSSPHAASPRLRPGHLPVRRRENDRRAARLPPPAYPLGATRRHPRGVPRPRHLPQHPPTRPTPRLCGTHRQSGPRPTGAGGSRRASLPSVPCATPTPASSSKPRVDRLSRPLARARRPWLYSAYIHALHARRGQARSRRHGCLVQRGGELPGNP